MIEVKLSKSNQDVNFEARKQDHIKLALDKTTHAENLRDLDGVELVHEALPDCNFDEVSTAVEIFGKKLDSPIFVSSMTAGHQEGTSINLKLARLSSERQIFVGVGSQRRELFDGSAASEWASIRKQAPNALLLGNLGISQLISSTTDQIMRLVDSLEALALFIHLNPLQEVLQPEGTPSFRGGLAAIDRIASELKIPVIVKEVGCGFSAHTLKRLDSTRIYAVDVSGAGGTHWGRIEGLRSEKDSVLAEASKVFSDWGVGTLRSMANAKDSHVKYQIWASGGVRSGLDAAKLLALGSEMVGLARPFLEAAVEGENALNDRYDHLKYQLRVAQFCTGCKSISELRSKGVWQWR